MKLKTSRRKKGARAPKSVPSVPAESSDEGDSGDLLLQAPIDPDALNILDMPTDLIRVILYRLDLRDQCTASQVCRDFFRLIYTDADPGSLGPSLIISLERCGSGSGPGAARMRSGAAVWAWGAAVPKVSIPCTAASPLMASLLDSGLLRGPRARRFGSLTIQLQDPFITPQDSLPILTAMVGNSKSPGGGGGCLRLALDGLSAAQYPGEIHLSNLMIVQGGWGPRVLRILADAALSGLAITISTSFYHLSPQEVRATLAALSEVAALGGLRAIRHLQLPAHKDLSYSASLASLPMLSGLVIGASGHTWSKPFDPLYLRNTEGVSLSSLRGLSQIKRLNWFPAVTAVGTPEARSLASLAGLRGLEVAQLTRDTWQPFARALCQTKAGMRGLAGGEGAESRTRASEEPRRSEAAAEAGSAAGSGTGFLGLETAHYASQLSQSQGPGPVGLTYVLPTLQNLRLEDYATAETASQGRGQAHPRPIAIAPHPAGPDSSHSHSYGHQPFAAPLACPALNCLTYLALQIEDADPTGLPPLGPLPPSIRDLRLWLRTPEDRHSFTLNVFEGLTNVEALRLRFYRKGSSAEPGVGPEGGIGLGGPAAAAGGGVGGGAGPAARERPTVRIGPSLGTLGASLTRLEVLLLGSLSGRGAVSLPDSLSRLSRLDVLRVEGGCGRVEVPRTPGHWVAQRVGDGKGRGPSNSPYEFCYEQPVPYRIRREDRAAHDSPEDEPFL